MNISRLFISSRVLPRKSKIWRLTNSTAPSRAMMSNHARNAVYDQARLALAFAQRLLGALALVDVDEQVEPADNVPVRIPKRKSARLKPAVDAIEASRTDFELEGFTGRDRMGEALDDAWKILGMSQPPDPQRLSSSNVLPKYSRTCRLTNSTSPPGVKAAMSPGMLSTIRRDSRSLSRSASSARFRSSISESRTYQRTMCPLRARNGRPRT